MDIKNINPLENGVKDPKADEEQSIFLGLKTLFGSVNGFCLAKSWIMLIGLVSTIVFIGIVLNVEVDYLKNMINKILNYDFRPNKFISQNFILIIMTFLFSAIAGSLYTILKIIKHITMIHPNN